MTTKCFETPTNQFDTLQLLLLSLVMYIVHHYSLGTIKFSLYLELLMMSPTFIIMGGIVVMIVLAPIMTDKKLPGVLRVVIAIIAAVAMYILFWSGDFAHY